MSPSNGEPITIAVTFVPTGGKAPATHVVSTTSDTTWGEVRALLPSALASVAWYAGADAVHDDAVVGQPPLLHAAELADRPHQPPQRPLLELAVAEGPDCGRIVPLADGTLLGRGAECDLFVRDPSLSRAHARIDLHHGHASVRDLGSTNGTWIDAARLDDEPRELHVGRRLRTGETVSRIVGVTTAPPLPLRAGRRALSRPPRQVPDLVETELVRPTAPAASDYSIPWLVMLLPLPVAVVLAVLMRSPMFLAFAVFSPLMMVGQYVHDRVGGRRSRRAEKAEFRTRTAQLEQALSDHLEDEVIARRRLAPDLAEIAAMVRAGRFWPRRPDDADHLLFRLGTGTVTAGVTVRTSGGDLESFELDRVPITIDLDEHRVSGLCGESDLLDRIVDSLVGQLVALHSPALLRLIVVTDRLDRWHWATWLPHLRPDTTGPPLVLEPDDDEALRGLLGAWTHEPDHPLPGAELPSVHTVVVLDGAGLAHRPLLHALVEHSGAHGVAVAAAATRPDGLPPDCTATSHCVDATSGELCDTGARQLFVPDLPADGWRERLAAAVAGTADTTPGAGSAEPPARVRLLDILDGAPTVDQLAERWDRTPRSTRILLGLGAEGVVELDLVRDGPHALVGGTTGSGKSELLQTFISALALGNRPDELVFLLVDYKGGAAFKDCVDLPHTVGLVTDLDPFLTRRALASLDAEIRRRERLLAGVGAKDLDDYREHARPSDPTIPRLVLVIDEFRVLAEELPEFIEGVVRLAAVGRSLGIHVVLATQRPAGIVSADIRANVNLRIALRVRDTTDSEDIIESPAAARIGSHTPGRALVRTGADAPVAVQSARVGGSAASAVPVRVLPVDARTGRVATPPADETPTGPSDLRVLVEAMRDAAEAAAVPEVPSPWLPSLPDLIPRSRCAGEPQGLDGSSLPTGVPVATLGMLDLPTEQRRAPAGWAPGTGHLAVVGGPRSGRTTALRTIATGLGETGTADDVHLYAIDTASGLSSLAALPHTGAVLNSADSAQVSRMFTWLSRECSRRQEVLAAGDHADLIEQRRTPGPDGPLPFIVLLLDGWDGFQAAYELSDAAALETLLQLLRDGPAVGLSVVLAGGRAVLSGRVAGAVQHRICLRMADEMDLVMAGLRPDQVPDHLPPGRGLVLPDGEEVHLAVPGEGADGSAQAAAVREVASGSAAATSHRPKRFEGLPDQVAWEQLDGALAPDDGSLLLGVGGEEALPAWWPPDPVHGTVALVAGPPRSGRTTTLLTLSAQLSARGPVFWLGCTGRPAELPESVRPVGTGDDAQQVWADLLGGFATLVIDDLELLPEVFDDLAVSFLDRCGSGDGALLAAGTTLDLLSGYRGIAHELRRRQSGLVLQPARGDGDLLGTELPHAGASGPGRGVLVRRTRGTEVQVATPPPPDRVPDLAAAGRHTGDT